MVHWGMKLIFSIYLDINRGNNFRKFIKNAGGLKCLFMPKNDFDQSNWIFFLNEIILKTNRILNFILSMWYPQKIFIEVKSWFRNFCGVIKHALVCWKYILKWWIGSKLRKNYMLTWCFACWLTSEAATWWGKSQMDVASNATFWQHFFCK